MAPRRWRRRPRPGRWRIVGICSKRLCCFPVAVRPNRLDRAGRFRRKARRSSDFKQGRAIQWEAAVTREAVNSQVLALAARGFRLRRWRTTGLSRETIRKIVRGRRHDLFRTRLSSLDPWLVRLEAEWTGGCRVGVESGEGCGRRGSPGAACRWRMGDPSPPRRQAGSTCWTHASARTIARGRRSNATRVGQDRIGQWRDNVFVERLWRRSKTRRSISEPTPALRSRVPSAGTWASTTARGRIFAWRENS